MKYTLMQKNYPVVDIEIIEGGSSTIVDTFQVYNSKRLPVSAINRETLQSWWKDRQLPYNRDGIEWAKQSLGILSESELLLESNALSLTDQYWIKKEGSDERWEDINFFDNEFPSYVGDFLLGGSSSDSRKSFRTPEATSSGWLKKKWVIIGKDRYLLKAGSAPYYQEPSNEVIASRVCELIDFEHTKYHIQIKENEIGYEEIFSLCKDYINRDTEFISAWQLRNSEKKQGDEDSYLHLVRVCKNAGIGNPENYFDKMIVLDYIMANTDRHYNNFGVIRNVDTLEYLGFAPNYDTGTSLWNRFQERDINGFDDVFSPGFESTLERQAQHVTTFDWLDFSSLKKVGDIVLEELSKYDRLSEARIDIIARAAAHRVEKLEEFVAEKSRNYSITFDIDKSVKNVRGEAYAKTGQGQSRQDDYER